MGPATERSKDLKVSDLFLENSQEWDREKIANLFSQHLEKILLIKPSKWGGKDKQIWLKQNSGSYSTRTGYFSAIENYHRAETEAQTPTRDWVNEVWKLSVSPKLRLFIWKVKHGAIPVGERLEARQILTGAKCPHCNREESILHLFFLCPYAVEVWNLIPFSEPFDPLATTDFDSGWKRLLANTTLPPIGLWQTPLATWVIWSARNQKIFQNRNFSAQDSVLKAILDAKEWQQAQPAKDSVNSQRKKLPSPRDPVDWIICKSDAAWKKEQSTAGLAWSFSRNQNERFVSHSTPYAFVISSLVAEGLAIRSAMEHAISLEMKNLVFESDSLQLVTAITEGSSYSDLYGIISHISLLSLFFNSVSFRFCSREKLSLEDDLAKQALNGIIPNSF